MSFHPNPMSIAVHVEHHRQELMALAEQERRAREAVAGRSRGPARISPATTSAMSRVRSLFGALRPALAPPSELSQSVPGEA